jgi:hypothetical protein
MKQRSYGIFVHRVTDNDGLNINLPLNVFVKILIREVLYRAVIVRHLPPALWIIKPPQNSGGGVRFSPERKKLLTGA